MRVEEFCGEVWSVLQEATNFSFSMVREKQRQIRSSAAELLSKSLNIQVESVDDNWGSKLDDGSWNGMVRLRSESEV